MQSIEKPQQNSVRTAVELILSMHHTYYTHVKGKILIRYKITLGLPPSLSVYKGS